jgi:hypothetical protein
MRSSVLLLGLLFASCTHFGRAGASAGVHRVEKAKTAHGDFPFDAYTLTDEHMQAVAKK